MVVALMASKMTDAYAKKNKKKEKIHYILDKINKKLDQYDADVNAAVTQHDSDVNDDLETINDNLLDHDTEVNESLTEINNSLTDVNNSLTDVIEPKLDAILAACGNGGATASVPKTGQTTSFATWDDGDLEKGVAWPNPRFTDNLDGTITDNLTELIWLKDANCTETVGGVEKDSFGLLNWSDALTWCNNMASGSCGLTDGSEAGDWRLPNIREHQSLIDYGFSWPALPEGNPFTNMPPNTGLFHWSSTTNATGVEAWIVQFHVGGMRTLSKNTPLRVWCVRGP
jgi:hypothetical protein